MSGDSCKQLQELVYDLGNRFSFNTPPEVIGVYHGARPSLVETSDRAQRFDGGSVTSELTDTYFNLAFPGDPSARLLYRFEESRYMFDRTGEMLVAGLRSIVFVIDLPFRQAGLRGAFGRPSSTTMQGADTFDCWDLPTPTSGGDGRERFIVAYPGAHPEYAISMWMTFPEHP